MLFERFAFCYYKYIILKDKVLKGSFLGILFLRPVVDGNILGGFKR